MLSIMKNKKLLCSVCFLFTFMSALCGQNITVKRYFQNGWSADYWRFRH